jgi:two-component system sensor histidine kinase ChvG
MVALVEALAEARGQRGVNRNCVLKVERQGVGPWLVPGDAPKLERVLENLFDNAISFSPPGGMVTVAISRSEDRLRIGVSDEGPGIPTEAREEVFERFHSLRPASEDFGNHSGLGLAIARTIVEAHDGTLVARDREGGKQGACLIIDLPAWEAG